MGVRGLHTFCKTRVYGGYNTVDMKTEAEAYKKWKGCNPILVVDLFSFHKYIYEGVHKDHEKLLGGRFEVYNDRLRNKLDTLKSLSFELVFFVDGASQQEKEKICLKRRDNEYVRGVEILHKIDDGLDLSGDLSSYDIPNISIFFENLICISREYGDLHITVLHECDQEMVRLANAKDAMAIISNDTDFIIFDGPWRLWNDLDFGSNTAHEYNKSALRKCLGLSQSQLILFASLAGNDFVSQELLSTFHNSLPFFFHEKFNKIAVFIKRINQLPNNMQDKDLLSLAQQVFADTNCTKGLQALRKSINFYCLTDMRDGHADSFLDQVAQKLSRFIYSMLKRDMFTVTFTFCDLSRNLFPPYIQFFIPLLCRVMGILFADRKNQNFTKTFNFKLEHDKPFTPVLLSPNYPSVKVPRLEELLITPYGENENLDTTRWKLLCFLVSPMSLKPDQIRYIPKSKLGICLTLYYLIEARIIEEDDADCILFSCSGQNHFPNWENKFSFDKIKRIDGRDARMVFLFLRTWYNMIANLSAVGLQDYFGLMTFDGFYFHNLRKVWKDLKSEELNSVRQNLQQFRIYTNISEVL